MFCHPRSFVYFVFSGGRPSEQIITFERVFDRSYGRRETHRMLRVQRVQRVARKRDTNRKENRQDYKE